MDTDKNQIINVIEKFYKIISGKAGERRDWNSFRRLFSPNAILTPHTFADTKKCTTILYDAEEYIKRLEVYFSGNDFYEEGVIHKIDIQNNIAQVDSSYAAKRNPDDKVPFKMGKNFIQLLNDGNDWKIVSMLWEDQ